MSTIDRAFIKAFSGSGAAGSRPAQANAAQPTQATEEPTHDANTVIAHESAANVSAPHASRFGKEGAAQGGKASPQTGPVILPLSAFAKTHALREELRPAFEVDRFIWPTMVDSIVNASQHDFDSTVGQLKESAGNGHKVIAVLGTRRGEGRTTLLLCLARRLAAAGVAAALVDADFRSPQLARRLGMAVRAGLQDVLTGELSLAEVLVESLGDRLTLLPLRKPLEEAHESCSSLRAAMAFDVLRHQFPLVLVDSGPLPALDPTAMSCIEEGIRIDAAVLVRDGRSANDEELQRAVRHLEQLGVPCLGVLENFTATPAPLPARTLA